MYGVVTASIMKTVKKSKNVLKTLISKGFGRLMVDLFVRKIGAMLFLKQVSGEDNSNTAEMIAP